MLVQLVCAAVLIAFMPASSVADSAVVFMYHRFGENEHPSTNIRVEQFREQLEYLQKGGFKVLPLARLIAFLQEGAELPEKAVVITVDDAYRSVYEVAFPILEEFGYPFTVFVSTGPVDQGLPNYMNWEQLRTMAGAGVSLANHGADHLYMVRRQSGETEEQWSKRISVDIDSARTRLEAELGATNGLLPSVFAYPYGEYNTGTAALLQERGYIAFGQQSGAIGALSDRRALPRYPMAEAFAKMDEFATKARSLPLPVTEVTPWDPVTSERRPMIAISLAESSFYLWGGPMNVSVIQCYTSGQGKTEIEWLEEKGQFALIPPRSFTPGRHRVNCTAPTIDGRYYWFSHQWVVQ